MDSRFGCHLFILLFMFSSLDNIQTIHTLNIERDVIFTPNQTIQVPGKTLFFDPNAVTALEIDRNRNNNIDDYIVEQNEENPWLEPLKHALYLMLNNKINSISSKSDVIPEENIQRTKFLELDSGRAKNSKFGDVINLANGKLEMDQATHFRLVEINENCIKYCLEETIDGHNITAFWSVHKIRHRDEHRGYRFEWKITVRKLRNGRFDGKRNVDSNTNTRSFLIRDQDYPKYFESSVKKKEIKMEKRIFNTQYDKSEFPFSLDYPPNPTQFDRDAENLNIGEYYGKGPTPPVRHNDRNPESTFTTENVNQLHHHYFLNKQEIPIFKATHFDKVSGFPINEFNPIAFPNAVQPSQISIPRIHNQIDSYGQTLSTSSQAPFQFPEPVKVQEPILPTTYRGHYDDNRESILNGEEKRNHFEHSNRNQLITFPVRHVDVNVIPISNINTTPSYVYDLHPSTTPSIQSLYNRHLINPLQSPLGPQQLYWLNRNRNNPNLNFVASFPYHENTFSELDPVYHGPSSLATPSGIPEITSEFYDTHAGLISQLPLQNVNDDNSYDASTEIHQTTSSTNTDSSFTTPLNVVTTTRADSSQIDDEKNSFPDSINAQLPPPESGTDVRVPYVEADKSHQTQSSRKNKKKHKKIPADVPVDDDASISVEKLKIEKIEEKTTKKPQRKYKSQRSTTSTEKPSWTPKRPRLRSSEKYKTNSEIIRNLDKKSSFANRRKLTLRTAASTTTTIEPQTELELDSGTTVSQEFTTENDPVTTTLSSNIGGAPRTSQSVQKSVSVHIAEKVTVIPRKSTKMVFSSKNEDINKNPKRIAKIKKVDKSAESSTEDYLEL